MFDRDRHYVYLLFGSFLSAFVLFSSELNAQSKQYHFYKPGQSRGSDAQFSPFSLLINGSLDAMRLGPDRRRDVTAIRWGTDFQNVWENLTRPAARIREYGWEVFRRQELFNLSLNVDDLQFIPNVADHVIGYGMQYVKITEWYDAHGFAAPVLWGVGTSLVYQYLNEMVQNGGQKYTNVDCIADVYIFNSLGFALFSFDGVKQFFSETLELNEWSLQPLYVVRNHHVENAGEQFLLRYRLPFAERYAPFVCWGVNTVAGMSYRIDAQNNISIGLGNAIAGMKQKERGEFLSATPNFEPALGLFWDTDGSLLTGLVLSGKGPFNAQLNVYPGMISVFGIQPGCYLGAGPREGLVFGVTFMTVPVSLGVER